MKTITVLWGLLWFALVGSVLAGTGGPDEEGYRWIDSDTTGGPVYNWIDITSLPGVDSILDWIQIQAGIWEWNEGYVKRPLGFSFPFYGNSYDTLYIHTNGHIGFELADVNLLTWINGRVPDSVRPNNSIFGYWDNLGLMFNALSGRDPQTLQGYYVFFWTNGVDTAAVEYRDWPHAGSSEDETFEVVLLGNGEIYMQYSLVSWPTGGTVGIENVGGRVGLEYLYDGIPIHDTLHPGLCIRFYHQDFLNEVKAVSIDIPGELVEPDSFTSPKATVKNRAVNPATFDVRCVIRDTLSVEVYGDTQQVTNLLPDSSYQVEFNPWLVGQEGNRYRVLVQTMLPGDEYPANDTLSMRTVAFHEVRVINSPYTYTVPTFDGSIDTVTEWGDAVRVDVSDVLGRSGVVELPGSVIIHVKNDSACLYAAIDHKADNTLEDMDGNIPFVDDNHDGLWAAGDLEGYYLVRHFASGDTVVFRAMPGLTPYAVPGSMVRIELTSGHVQQELCLPLGANNYELNASPGDTMGLFYIVDDYSEPGYTGWWPTTMRWADRDDPSTYGDIVLGIGPGVEEETREVRSKKRGARLLQNYPNPFNQQTVISFIVHCSLVRVNLRVYDVTGRLLRTLVDEERVESGQHRVMWDGRDDTGANVVNGIYFYQLQADDSRMTKKLLVSR